MHTSASTALYRLLWICDSQSVIASFVMHLRKRSTSARGSQDQASKSQSACKRLKGAYLQALSKAGLVLLLEEVHVLRAVLQDVVHAVLQVRLHGSAGRAEAHNTALIFCSSLLGNL